MKVLLLSHYFEFHGGGIELVVGRLARELRSRGLDVAWAATGPASGETDGIERIAMHSFNLIERATGLPYPIWTPTGYPALVSAVRDADVVHVHDAVYFGSQLAGGYARRRGKGVVLTQHVGGIPFRSAAYRLMHGIANRFLSRPLLERADRVVFVSERVRGEFAGLRFAAPPRMIANGVDADLFHPGAEPRSSIRARLGLESDRAIFLFVGRFSPKKGLARIRAAAAALPQVRWVLIGWGNEDPRTWGLGNVTAPGRLPQEGLPDWYRAADLLVLPSVGEGFPLVVQEAMACGTPALVSDETAAADPSVAPFLRSAGENGVAFLEACEEWLRMEPSARASAQRGVALRSRPEWSWTSCADAYLQVYRSALEDRERTIQGLRR